MKRYPRSRLQLARRITANVARYREGDISEWHQHAYGQLVFSIRGVARVLTPTRTWTLPPSRAAWLPSYIDHELHAVGESDICNVYIEPAVFPWPWREPTIVHVTPFVRELAVSLSEGRNDYQPGTRADLSASLLLMVLAELPQLPETGVPLPRDERLLKICEHAMNDPASDRSLEAWGEQLGASARTLADRFKDETGLTLGAWKRQLRVAEAITRLAMGQSVTKVSSELGYQTPSAFIAMFRQVTGESPQRYLWSK